MKPEIKHALEVVRAREHNNVHMQMIMAELERLDDLINNPETQVFLEGVKLETAHQHERWVGDDEKKEPSDWFWTLGYLSGKAMNAQIRGDTGKALHHVVTSAAMCAQWHSHLLGTVRPPFLKSLPRVGDGVDHNLGGHGITTPRPAFP